MMPPMDFSSMVSMLLRTTLSATIVMIPAALFWNYIREEDDKETVREVFVGVAQFAVVVLILFSISLLIPPQRQFTIPLVVIVFFAIWVCFHPASVIEWWVMGLVYVLSSFIVGYSGLLPFIMSLGTGPPDAGFGGGFDAPPN